METVFLFANSSNNYENENNESFAKKELTYKDKAIKIISYKTYGNTK